MRPTTLVAAPLLLFFGAPALAASEVTLAPSEGVAAITVKVDSAAGVVRYKVADGAIQSLPIALAAPYGEVKVETIDIGQGKRALVARIASVDRPIGFGAIFVGKPDAPVAWSGLTGYVIGQPGGMTGEQIDVILGDAAQFVVVGAIAEENRICGQDATLLSPRVLDPGTLTLRSASVQRLPASQLDAAQPVIANALASAIDPPLAKLLATSGASTAIGSPGALVDRDPATTWSEGRSGAGRGEFVSFSSPAEVPIARLTIAVAPAAPSPTGAAPRTFFVVTRDRTLKVTMPEDAWLHPKATYEIPLASPIKSSCLSIVLDEAYARNLPKPDVTLDEVSAYADLESKGATVVDVALALTGGGARADAAAGLLKRAGDSGTTAVAAVYDKLDAPGRALAMDVAASAPCSSSGVLLVKALSDADEQVSHKAESKLDRCGKAAAPAMVDAVKGTDTKARAKAAGILALVAPSDALLALAGVLADGPTETRALTRRAFATASRSATIDKLGALLDDPARTRDQKLEMLRALDPRLLELGARASATLDATLTGQPDFRLRYLSLPPLVTLARAHDAAATKHLLEMLAHDPDAPIRAQAAELATQLQEAQPALVALLADPDPRVRDAAIRALTPSKLTSATAAFSSLLKDDRWVFVRVSAALALGALPASPQADEALGASLSQGLGYRVIAATIDALGSHRARAQAEAVRKRLDDLDQPAFVRASAARALGAMCDVSSYDRLTELAQAAASPVASADELTVALAAIEALGLAHPLDVGKRLAPIDDKSVKQELRMAARRAFTMKGSCSP